MIESALTLNPHCFKSITKLTASGVKELPLPPHPPCTFGERGRGGGAFSASDLLNKNVNCTYIFIIEIDVFMETLETKMFAEIFFKEFFI
jgi:hypothetical protein